tara:strand:- start:5119 stop:6036 length:918 start_codon:yes stop_codon:yes gene_type:complete
MMKIFISTIPFGSNPKALALLKENNIDFLINQFDRKVTEDDLLSIISDFDGLIAGTEPITKRVIDCARNLKVISRLGVGTDNIDIKYAQSKNIEIEVTKDAPTNAVAEHTIALMLNLLRNINSSDKDLKKGIWQKKMGKEISQCVIGVIGAGKIGNKVIGLINSFQPKQIFYSDPFIELDERLAKKTNLNYLLRHSDIITLHLPLNANTKHLIGMKELSLMKSDSILVNTSRGDLIDEGALHQCLLKNSIGGVALDVFSKEPYKGELTNLENCLLTPHISPMTEQARSNMEIASVENLLKHLTKN